MSAVAPVIAYLAVGLVLSYIYRDLYTPHDRHEIAIGWMVAWPLMLAGFVLYVIGWCFPKIIWFAITGRY